MELTDKYFLPPTISIYLFARMYRESPHLFTKFFRDSLSKGLLDPERVRSFLHSNHTMMREDYG